MVITNGIGNTYAYAGPNQGLFVNGNNVTVEIPFVPNGEPVVRFLWQAYGAVSGTNSLTNIALYQPTVTIAQAGMIQGWMQNSGITQVVPGMPLAGTSSSLGGGLLASSACTLTTVTVTGASTSAPLQQGVEVTPSTNPGAYSHWYDYISAANTVTVDLCNGYSSSETPTAATYAVRVY